jgi:arylsulfatase A-like enzyme
VRHAGLVGARRRYGAPLRVPSVFLPAATLAATLVVCKALLLGATDSPDWSGAFVALAWQDVAWATLYGFVAWAALRTTNGRPALQRWLWRIVIVAGALSVAYGIIHVGFYQSFRRPINVQMLRFAGNVHNLRSSVTDRLTWTYVLPIVGLPLAFAAAFWRPRAAWPKTSRVGVAVALAWIVAGRAILDRSDEEWMRRMGQNPHLTLLSSVVLAVRGSSGVTLPRDFPAEDALEFRTIAARAGKTAAVPAPRRGELRNVIFIVLESTGARYMSLYGARYDTTPRLLAEAGNALVVDHAYAHIGYTFCSFMAVNFSRYPGLPWCYLPCGERPLPPTLADVLKERGYRTAFLTSGDGDYEGIGYVAEKHGYDAVRDYRALGCPAISSWGAADSCVADGVLRFVDENPQKPFFVMAWTDQTHDPYVLPQGAKPVTFAGVDAALGRYLNIVRSTDEQIGRILDGLRSRGLADSTLVVVTGDHGEAFGDLHDYRGHGGELYEENVWVPLVFWNPKVFAAAPRSTHVGGHVDIDPTILDLLGVPAPADWQGASFFDPARADRVFFFTGVGEFQFGMRDARYKYVYSATFGRDRLSDLTVDLDERHDLSTKDPERSRRMRQHLAAWISAEEGLLMGPVR